MQHRSVSLRSLRKWLACLVPLWARPIGSVTLALTPCARADVLTYLVNVAMRPGYNGGDADTTWGYSRSFYDKVPRRRTYALLMGDVKADSDTSDEYASYPVSLPVHELCLALIWRCRTLQPTA